MIRGYFGCGDAALEKLKFMGPSKQKLEAIFTAALELGSQEQRDIYLNRACEGDAAFREQIDALLRAVDNADRFFEQGGAGFAVPPSGGAIPDQAATSPKRRRTGSPHVAEPGSCGSTIVHLLLHAQPAPGSCHVKFKSFGAGVSEGEAPPSLNRACHRAIPRPATRGHKPTIGSR